MKITRIVIVISIGLIGILLVGLLYRYKREKEPVWSEHDLPAGWLGLLPLDVWIDPEFGDHQEGAQLALEDFNDAAGCMIFRRVGERERARVVIESSGCATDPNHAGCTFMDRAGARILIQVGQPGNVTDSYLAFYHELGHALGLAHDGVFSVPEDPRDILPSISIMANNVLDHSYRLGQGHFLPRLTSKDSEAIKEKYCP